MKTLIFSLSLISLSLLTACGSSSPLASTGTGSYSNATLTGQYVYQLSGQDLSNGGAQYRESGVFTADGKGDITAGSDDFSEGSSGIQNSSITGTYTIANDGTGAISLTFANGTAINLAVTLVSSTKVYLIDGDTTLNASGVAEQQNSAAIASIPAGTWIFKMQTTSTSQGSAAAVGSMTAAGGTISGSEDVNRAGVSSSLTLTAGLLNAPNSFGVGSASITDSSGVSLSLNYYIVDSSDLRFLVSTPGINGIGSAAIQTSTAGLSGSYAFGSRGDDAYAIGGVRTVGCFTAASGSITAGAYDSVQDGVPTANATFNGTYTTAANGRSAVTLASGTQQVFWTVSSSEAFFVTTTDPVDTSNVELGTASLQQSNSFAKTNLKGQYAFRMDGFDSNNSFFVDRVGWLQWSGSTGVSLSEVVNDSGAGGLASGLLTGSYTVAANGRATATITNFSENPNDLIIYLVSGSEGYLLQSDSGLEIGGKTELQQ